MVLGAAPRHADSRIAITIRGLIVMAGRTVARIENDLDTMEA
jgi:hypothetical protein